MGRDAPAARPVERTVMTEMDATEWSMVPLPELLRVIGGIFDELCTSLPRAPGT